MISKKEFKEIIRRVQPILSKEDVSRIFKEVDLHRNKKVNYSEFLIAAINVK